MSTRSVSGGPGTGPDPDRDAVSDAIPFPRTDPDPMVSDGDTIDGDTINTVDAASDTVEDSSGTHFQVDLDPEPEPGGAAVDLPPARQAVLSTKDTRRPVIPVGIRGWANTTHTLRHAARHVGYVVGYHAVRAPWYAVKTGWWALIGAARLASRHVAWWWVAESHTLRRQAANANDPATWLRLHQETRRTRFWRGIILAVEALAGVFGLPVVWALAPWWATTAAVTAAVLLLARLGRPVDQRILSTAIVAGRQRRLTADVVLRAYYAAGLGKPDKPDQAIGFGSTMSRDATDTGSQVVIDLPYGRGFADAVKAKGAIASGLDVSLNQVFLTPDASSNRRHVLFVADRDPLAIPAGTTPLLDGKVRDIWQPAPLGLDERGRKVSLSLMWISLLIGAQPRKGKTFFARLIALFAALDPYVRLTIVDGKMSSDWDKFRLVAHRMVVGKVPNPRDDNPVENLLEALREIDQHIRDVNNMLSTLPVTECPEGKITRELGRRYPVLRPWMLVMEEFQVYYELDDQDTNKEIAGLLSTIMSIGPSAGVILVGASQKPSGIGAGDVARLFNRFRDNFAVRFALRCGNRNVSEAVLGGDAYAEGFDASALPNGEGYRGIGILYGASDDTPILRSHLADHVAAEKILTAARRHREAASTLSGTAIGEDLVRKARDVLADARAMVNPGDTGLHWEELAARLGERNPEHYADITADTISAQLRALRVPSVNVKQAGVVRKGCRVEDIDTLLAARPGR